jgi:hypothetical protein
LTASTRFHSSSVVSGHRLGHARPGVGPQQVEFPEPFRGGAHRPGDVVRAGRVAGQEHRPAVPRRDRVRHPLAAGPVLVEEDQGRPVRGEQVRARRPDPAGRAGDDPDPAAQPLVAGRGGSHDHSLGLPRALAQMMIIRSAEY